MRLPTGTVTLLFTDVEGSTRLLEAFGDHYIDALVEQRRLIEDAVRDNDGFVVDTQGDSFFCVFATGAAAVRAALVAQRALASYSWPHGCVISVRMGIHTGNPSVR
ncbi:MAG: hypothetical protein QOH95_1849, partial [Gaiellaceae bacterium]|nr:hypothetical protein [Gaiellaceae bacterium]